MEGEPQVSRIGEEGFTPGDRCLTPSAWQEVLHGDTRVFRAAVADHLEREVSEKRATSYALCGCGDQVQRETDEYRVRPLRCGHALCPRCSRYRGLKFVKRVTDHLRSYAHGSLHHVTLTQQGVEGESLGDARKRFERRFNEWFERARRVLKVRGALRTTHITWSDAGWWHYHGHLVIECMKPAELAERGIGIAIADWGDICKRDGDQKKHADVSRVVCDEGAQLVGLADGGSEFWVEEADAVTKAVQYVARDVCQGVGSWNLCSDGAPVAQLLSDVKAVKFRRLYGPWRKAVPKEELEPAAELAADAKPAAGVERVDVGTVDTVLDRARQGEPSYVAIALWLLRCSANQSALGKRLVAVVGAAVKHARPATLVA